MLVDPGDIKVEPDPSWILTSLWGPKKPVFRSYRIWQ